METKEQRIARQVRDWRERLVEWTYETGKGWYAVLEPAEHLIPGPASLEGYMATHDSLPEAQHLTKAIERAKALGQDRTLTDYTVKP